MKAKEKKKRKQEDKPTRMSSQILKMKDKSKMKNIKNNKEKRNKIGKFKAKAIKKIQLISWRKNKMDDNSQEMENY